MEDKSLSTSAPSHSGPLSLQNLPCDVLSHIFTLCVPPEGVLIGTIKKVSSPPHTFSLVCSWWRTVAFANPIIWATISVICDPFSLLGFDYYEKTLLYHVMRSQHVPLVVNVSFPSSPIRKHAGLFLFVAQNSARIRRFTLKTLVDSWMQMMDIMTRSTVRSESTFIFPIDNLSFEFVVAGFRSMERIGTSIRGVSFPGLRSFSIACGENGRTFTRDWTFPWSQLSSLTFLCHHDADISHIISSCPRLRYLYIGLYVAQQAVSSSTAPSRRRIVLPDLTELTLCITHAGLLAYTALERVLPLFSSPSLTSLSLVPEFDGHHNAIIVPVETDTAASSIDAFFEEMISFVSTQPKCVDNVTQLEIKDVFVTERSLKRLVWALGGSLRELRLSTCEVSEGWPGRPSLHDRPTTMGEVVSIGLPFFLDGVSTEEEERRLRKMTFYGEARCRLVR